MLVFDAAKRAANIAKHGIDFNEAESFDWTNAVVFEDRRFDYGEVREIALGRIRGRLHVLIFTRRKDEVRVISLRKANAREERAYAKAAEA